MFLDALKRKKSDDILKIIANFGDPMMPVCAGMLSSASENCHVMLAGGTQMLAVLQLAKHHWLQCKKFCNWMHFLH